MGVVVVEGAVMFSAANGSDDGVAVTIDTTTVTTVMNGTNGSSVAEEGGNYYESLENFRYYTEGVLLTPVSVFGIMGNYTP